MIIEYITPTNFVKHFMTKENFIELDMNGKKLSGEYEASSEYRMHLKIYKEREDVNVVFHAHPM